ncbi:MAG TPA: hypothetical protein VJ755_09740 [Gemmatimonadales bacterium]|nr:hypothetical protein [Gemmatimonadales bacterium]
MTAAAAGLGGCGDAFSPPPGATRLDPPPIYKELWREVEGCSGLSRSMAWVNWFLVPEHPFPCGTRFCAGLWVSPHNIYLSDVAAHDQYGDNYLTVRHEILHELVRKPGHPPVFSQCELLREGTDY